MELVQLWPVIAFVVVQFVGFIWKFSTMESRLKHIEQEMVELKKVNERLAGLESSVKSIQSNLAPITAYILGRQ